jgi:hypothetical protein
MTASPRREARHRPIARRLLALVVSRRDCHPARSCSIRVSLRARRRGLRRRWRRILASAPWRRRSRAMAETAAASESSSASPSES